MTQRLPSRRWWVCGISGAWGCGTRGGCGRLVREGDEEAEEEVGGDGLEGLVDLGIGIVGLVLGPGER